MPKKTYPKSLKAKSKGPWPTRGKRRANIKKPASKTMKSSTTVSCVRHGEVTTTPRPHRARWGPSIQNFSAMPYKKALHTLQRDGILPKWTGQVCPRCGMGKLGKLKFVKTRKTWMHQCSSRGCKRYLQPDDFHPIFFRGAGSSVTPLHVEVCIFYAALAGVSVNSAHLILNTDHKAAERVYSNLDAARARYVEHKEKSITYGSASGDLWRDVEADEVDVGKALEEDSDQKPKLRAATRRCVPTASIYSCKGPPCVLIKLGHKSMFDILRDGVAISSFGKSYRSTPADLALFWTWKHVMDFRLCSTYRALAASKLQYAAILV